MNCPKCGSPEVRTSRRTGSMDRIQSLRGQTAYRCRQCRYRFYAAASADAVTSRSSMRPRKLLSSRRRKRVVRSLIALIIFAFSFYIFWMFLRYETTEKPAAPSSSRWQAIPFPVDA